MVKITKIDGLGNVAGKGPVKCKASQILRMATDFLLLTSEHDAVRFCSIETHLVCAHLVLLPLLVTAAKAFSFFFYN